MKEQEKPSVRELLAQAQAHANAATERVGRMVQALENGKPDKASVNRTLAVKSMLAAAARAKWAAAQAEAAALELMREFS